MSCCCFGLLVAVPLSDASSWSRLIVGVFYLVGFSFDLPLTVYACLLGWEWNANIEGRGLSELSQLEEKDTTISNLKKHIANLKEKEKAAADCNQSVNTTRVISLGMYKADLQPLPSILRKNKKVHEDYLKITKEHTDTLRGIVEQDRALELSNNSLDFPMATHKMDFHCGDGTKCPMTRITSTPIVSPKETSQTHVITSNLEIKVVQNRPLVLGLGLLRAHNQAALSAHQLFSNSWVLLDLGMIMLQQSWAMGIIG
ncbi:hypothetical protein Tco_0409167 [Tanacetum coccineum]